MRQPQGSRRDEAGGSRRGGALLRTALAVAVLFGVLPVSAASATPAPVQVGDAWIESHPIVSVDPESGVPRVVGRQDKRVFIAETVPGIEGIRDQVPADGYAAYQAEKNEMNARLASCAGNWKVLQSGDHNEGTVYLRTDGFLDEWLKCVGGTAAEPRPPYIRLCEDDPATPALDYANCVLAASHVYASSSRGGGSDIMELRSEGRRFRDQLLALVEPQQPTVEYSFATNVTVNPFNPSIKTSVPTFANPLGQEVLLAQAFPSLPIGPLTGPRSTPELPVWLERAVYDCAIGYGLSAGGAYVVTRKAQELGLGAALLRGQQPDDYGLLARQVIEQGQALGIANMAGVVGCATRAITPYIPSSSTVFPDRPR